MVKHSLHRRTHRTRHNDGATLRLSLILLVIFTLLGGIAVLAVITR